MFQDHGRGAFNRAQQGKSQVKQLCKHSDFNNTIPGIWLQLLNPTKHSRGQGFFLAYVVVCAFAHMCVSTFIHATLALFLNV